MTAPIGSLKNIPFGIICLFLFLFSMTLSVRKVFFVFSPDGSGTFNEYTDISLYVSDIAFTLFFLFIILENIIYILSILTSKRLFHVEQWNAFFVLPLPFLLWSTASSFWAKSYELGIYTSLRLWEGYVFLVLLGLLYVPRGTYDDEQKKCSTWNIWKKSFQGMILLGLFQSLIALGQVWKQGSLGLSFLKESSFSVAEPGIAKIILFDQVFIRPYGLFLHPNILSGFLGITLLFTIAYPLLFHRKMFHVEQISLFPQIVPRGTMPSLLMGIKEKCSTWNKFPFFHKLFHVEQLPWWYRVVLVTQLFSFLLTFSKTGWIAFGLTLIYFVIGVFHVEQSFPFSKNVPRGTKQSFWLWIKEKCSTWNNPSLFRKMFHVEHWGRILSFLLVGIGTFVLIRSLNWYFFLWQPFQERLFLQKGYIAEISQNLFFGTGIGQSVLVMQDFSSEKLLSWQFQPAHNVYLLLWAETGLIGITLLVAIGVYFWKLFHVEQFFFPSQNVPRGTKEWYWLIRILKGSMLYLLLISLFDHYVWDIESTRMLFWYILGLLIVAMTSWKILTKYK